MPLLPLARSLEVRLPLSAVLQLKSRLLSSTVRAVDTLAHETSSHLVLITNIEL
jgi:hypothetical protein